MILYLICIPADLMKNGRGVKNGEKSCESKTFYNFNCMTIYLKQNAIILSSE